ncbi:MAG TPA: type II secretion system protein [Rhodocyclaceae bacterium]
MCTSRRVRLSQFRRQRGMSLVELIIFIVIVGVSVAGVLAVFSTTARSSADPLVRKQLIAVAEALLEEVALQPFTYCDPDDGNALWANAAATGAGDCATQAEAIGPEAGESRYSLLTPFDNVNDYAGFSMSPVRDLQNLPIPALAPYSAAVAVSPVGGSFGLAADDALQIDVVVSGAGESFTLSGLRFRFAPNVSH